MRTVAANFLLFASLLFARGDEGREPMVAFHCSQPAMYQTDNGWIKDDSTGCLKDPAEILKYCRKVFPTLDVRNVVEASDKVTVPNWCDFGRSMCNQQFTVIPFRCLVGPFQSDALLVPEHCIFDHIHDSKICSSYSDWNQTSFRSCRDRDLVQQSFAMLQPCGIDKFNGVEFVCCPTEEAVKEPEKPVVERASTAVPTPRLLTERPKTTKNDDFTEYINQPMVGRKWNEHEYYIKAKNDMRKHHHDKVAKMMKDWAAARQRVQDLKAIDPKASENLNKEITSRFQKTYEAEEVESEMEKKQLATLHQQRVQAELNDKKRRALDNYVQAIDDYDADSTEILKALKHYVKALQKDRLHTVNHYRHLLETDPAEADASRSQMADHLRGLDQQLNQALNMLDRVPKFRNKIKKQMTDFLDSYHSIDTSISVLFLDPEPTTAHPTTGDASKKKVEEDVDDQYEDGEEEYDEKDEQEILPEPDEVTKRPEEDDYDDYGVDEIEEEEEEEEEDETDVDDDVASQQSTTVSPSSSSSSSAASPASKTASAVEVDDENNDDGNDDDDEGDDDSDNENDEDVAEQIHVKHEEHVANLEKSYLHLNEPYVNKSPVKGMNSFNAAVPLGIAVGGITVFVVIVVGVIVMRRRAHLRRPPRPVGSLDLDPTASPEERHVASMQMNGYENPTYKYFEMNSTA